MKKILFSVLAMTNFVAFAGGFQVNLQGMRSVALGGAYVGLAHGPATNFFNPGGLTNNQGHQFSLGLNTIHPSISLQTEEFDNIDLTTKMSTPIYFYYSGQITEKLHVGFGVNNQFGNSSSFEDDWQGRYIVQNIGLKTFMFQPSVAYKIHEKLSLGVGGVFTTGSFSYEKAVPLTGDEAEYGKARLEGGANSFSFNVGLFSKLVETDKIILSVGADYRSGINLSIDEGTATFTDIPNSLRGTFPETTAFSGKLNLPSVTTAGLALNYKLSEKNEITFLYDYALNGWSSYDTLAFNFENEATPDSKTPKNWTNASAHRFGLEFKMDKIYFRAGVYHDQTPTEENNVSPEAPEATHMAPTFGLGANISDNFIVDVSYIPQNYSGETAAGQAGFEYSYNRSINVLSISATFKLKGKEQATEIKE